ncbi:hypothetical protein [Ensifer canadensis]
MKPMKRCETSFAPLLQLGPLIHEVLEMDRKLASERQTNVVGSEPESV